MTSALLIFHIICASVSYIISYLVIKRIKESQNSMKLYDHHQLSRQRTFQHAHKQLVCLSALSSSFCSYNLIICTLLQSGIHFREEWHIWLAVIVLPINSVLFPILTSFTTNAFRAFLFSLFSKLSPNTSTHGIFLLCHIKFFRNNNLGACKRPKFYMVFVHKDVFLSLDAG